MLERNRESDFSLSTSDNMRFRVNMYYQRVTLLVCSGYIVTIYPIKIIWVCRRSSRNSLCGRTGWASVDRAVKICNRRRWQCWISSTTIDAAILSRSRIQLNLYIQTRCPLSISAKCVRTRFDQKCVKICSRGKIRM